MFRRWYLTYASHLNCLQTEDSIRNVALCSWCPSFSHTIWILPFCISQQKWSYMFVFWGILNCWKKWLTEWIVHFIKKLWTSNWHTVTFEVDRKDSAISIYRSGTYGETISFIWITFLTQHIPIPKWLNRSIPSDSQNNMTFITTTVYYCCSLLLSQFEENCMVRLRVWITRLLM